MSDDFYPAPKGLLPDEPLDPEVLHADVARMKGVAGRSTQHQWTEAAFDSEQVFAEGTPVRIREAKVTAKLYQEVYDNAVATINGGPGPLIRPATNPWGGWTVDPNIYQVPYNRGLQPVEDMRVEWTSPYPELLWVIQDLQYLRTGKGRFGFDSTNTPAFNGSVEYRIRFKARIAVDSAMLPGTGPEVSPINTRYRGSGFGGRAMRTNFSAMTMVPAGSHVVQLFAGQGPADPTSEQGHLLETEKDLPYDPEPPTQGVVLGHRSLIVVAFPFGMPLGG